MTVVDPISGIEKILLALMLAVIMFGMGAGITEREIRQCLRQPKGVLVGLCSQFGLMPLIACGLSYVLQLPPAAAIGLIMIGCLPGGSTSNMFCYFARGDVALSVTMTTCSTICALFLMPLTLGVYTEPFIEAINAAVRTEQVVPSGAASHTAQGGMQLAIPYRDIVATLALVLIPVAGGLWLRRRSAGWAKVAEETASFAGFMVIVFLIVSWLSRAENRANMLQTDWNVYLAVVAVGVIGVAFGWVMARVLRCAPRQRRAIALETGIQNSPLAFAIIAMSFAGHPLMGLLLWVPILYALFIVISASVVTLVMRRYAYADWEAWKNRDIQQQLFTEWR